MNRRRLSWQSLLLGLPIVVGLAGAPGCRPNPGNSTPSALGSGTPSGSGGHAFRNIAEESGLASFRHADGGSGRKFFVEQMGSGCALFDFDGDGKQDVYLASGSALPGYKGEAPGNRLFRNLGENRFEDVTEHAGVKCGKYATGVAVADYDNDGDMDLYVCCFGPNVLYRNNGDGTFTDVTNQAKVADPRLSSSAAWGDYNGDGKLDLFVANYVKYDLKKDRWCSKFPGHKSFCGPNLYDPELSILYRNNGDGSFTDVSKESGIASAEGNGFGVVWLDYNEDGRQDIFVANDQSPNHLWHNNGDGTFREVAAELGVAFGEEGNARAGMGVDVGDYDNDGHPDLMVTNFSEESNALYRNESGSFRDVAMASGMGSATLMYLGFGTAFLDYDRDGWLDLFFANGHVLDDIAMYSDSVKWEQPMQLFRNRSNGTFEEVSQSSGVGEGSYVGRGAAFGDLDNDGRTDILVNVLQNKPILLHNEAAPNAHWLGLDLKAAWGNPHAIGATVTVTTGGLKQKRYVRTAGSFESSNDVRPLFGLGNANSVDELRIDWPSGQTTALQRPKIDGYLRVEEPPTSGPKK